MKRFTLILMAVVAILSFTSCSENYSNGERIGLVTKFSEKGFWWKSWEGDLTITQTGMNQANSDFMFAITPYNYKKLCSKCKANLDSAAQYGWKVKIFYHQVFCKNWFSNRGETDYFVNRVEVLDRNPLKSVFGGNNSNTGGKVIDTIYVVIVPKK
jgi:hypothetical protein